MDPVAKENCIKACNECLRACRECLLHGGCPACDKTCLTCIETCRACVALMEFDSPLAKEMCKVCEEACKQCAAECNKCGDRPHAKKCANLRVRKAPALPLCRQALARTICKEVGLSTEHVLLNADVGIGVAIPFSSVGGHLGSTRLPRLCWPLYVLSLLSYALLTQGAKAWLL